MKREYIKPESKQLHLLLCSIMAGSPQNGYEWGMGEEGGGNSSGGETGGSGDDDNPNSRYLRKSMWDDL